MLSIAGLVMASIIPATTTSVGAAPFSAGSPVDNTVTINCSNAVMTTVPTFLSAPKGSAKYPFSMKCTSPNKPGLMIFSWEGSWSPSETRRDRPNASETLTIIGYEPFLPDRTPGGKLFMYWTGSCTGDPWLQGGSCSRFGEYMPDDLRVAFPNIGSRPFPLTGNSISVGLKQQLINQYQAANQPVMQQSRIQNMAAQMQQSQGITPSQRAQAMTVQPQTALPKPNTAASDLARSGIFSRGVEEKNGQTSGQQAKEAQTERAETSDLAVLEEGTEIVDPIALTIDRPLHVVTAKGDAVVLKPGTYEIGAVMNIQLGLAQEGQPTVLVHAHRALHGESLQRSIAMVVPGESDQVHLVLLTIDGRRFDAHGSFSAVKPSHTDVMSAISDENLRKAIQTTSVKPRSPSPACQPNTADIGPRWIPVPCTMPIVDHP